MSSGPHGMSVDQRRNEALDKFFAQILRHLAGDATREDVEKAAREVDEIKDKGYWTSPTSLVKELDDHINYVKSPEGCAHLLQQTWMRLAWAVAEIENIQGGAYDVYLRFREIVHKAVPDLRKAQVFLCPNCRSTLEAPEFRSLGMHVLNQIDEEIARLGRDEV